MIIVVVDEVLKTATVTVVHVDLCLRGRDGCVVELNDAIMVPQIVFKDAKFIRKHRVFCRTPGDDFTADQLPFRLALEEICCAFTAAAKKINGLIGFGVVP